MEHFKTKAIESSPLKPKLWKIFVDDTYIIWPHGKEKLDNFLKHFNNQSSSIQFTMEMEENESPPFLDILIKRNQDGTISHQVYHKKTHTEHYLHTSSHHHPAQKLGILNTMATRVVCISDQDHFEQENNHLMDVFENNGYRRHQGIKVFKKAENPKNKQPMHEYAGKVNPPYILDTTDKISYILKKNNIKTIFKPMSTISRCLKSVKNPIDPKCHKGVYLVPCSYSKTYIDETGRSISTRI